MTTSNKTIRSTNEPLEELNKRLGVIISLLLRMVDERKSSISLKEQVKILDSLSLRPRDIAAILGRTSSHINKELSGIRRENK